MPITIGRPTVHFDPRHQMSFVQLQYLNTNLEVLNLWSGNHPYIKLKESDVAFSITYAPGEVDVTELIDEQISEKVVGILEVASIEIVRGYRVKHKLGWYHLRTPEVIPIKGLYLPKASAYKKWFD